MYLYCVQCSLFHNCVTVNTVYVYSGMSHGPSITLYQLLIVCVTYYYPATVYVCIYLTYVQSMQAETEDD